MSGLWKIRDDINTARYSNSRLCVLHFNTLKIPLETNVDYTCLVNLSCGMPNRVQAQMD